MTCAAKLLAYCVAEDAAISLPATGVRGAPVRVANIGGISCVYSPLVPPQEFDRDDALRFHSVLKVPFEQQAIIPFRFPTLLQNEADLQAHMREKSALYREDLKKLRDSVQMELRITANQTQLKPNSGTEYLRSKQELSRTLQSAAGVARVALGDLVAEWKERPSDQGLRCYALLKRADIATARQRVEAAPISASATMILSGPWPATEFLHE